MGCNAGPILNRNWVGRTRSCVQCTTYIVETRGKVRQNVDIYNLEIHTDVYILIDLCSVEAPEVLNFTQWQFFYLHISKMAAIR